MLHVDLHALMLLAATCKVMAHLDLLALMLLAAARPRSCCGVTCML